MTNLRTGGRSIDHACVAHSRLPRSGILWSLIAYHHCLALYQRESVMPSPKAQDLSTNFKARARRRLGQRACNFEILAWSVFEEGSDESVRSNSFRHDRVALLKPSEQAQPLRQERDQSRRPIKLS